MICLGKQELWAAVLLGAGLLCMKRRIDDVHGCE